jgi:hypothetical protein
LWLLQRDQVQLETVHDLKLSRQLNSIKSSRARSRVNWLQEETDVSGTISVPETSVSFWNQLTPLCAQEDFIGNYSLTQNIINF